MVMGIDTKVVRSCAYIGFYNSDENKLQNCQHVDKFCFFFFEACAVCQYCKYDTGDVLHNFIHNHMKDL